MMNEYEARQMWNEMTPTMRSALMDYAACQNERYLVSEPVLWLSSRGLITVKPDGVVCGQTMAWLNLTKRGDALVTAAETLGLHI